MEQSIKINVPDGKICKQSVDNNGNVIIEFVDEQKGAVRSKSWEEFCKNHHGMDGYYISIYSNDVEYGWTNKNITSKHLLATKADAKANLALIQLTRLHDEWVGDWKHVSGIPAHTIIRTSTDEIVITVTNEQRLLQFPTETMIKEFVECFYDLLERTKKFI